MLHTVGVCIFLVGFGGLSLSVEGPSKADIECGENPDGTCLVKYTPTEPGNYVVNVKFAEEHIPGNFPVVNNLYITTCLR